ncbi:U2 small nuclear ribonucleoprotein auxiliary factor 35 kDa subunit-related protein 2-like [Corticium candelabrum]|uniref:U2 small nuclear ribonucleoprotein auxiliary factor 35 kDa subunit-related protein 2-like n=1 Tax=Corticium candelabrum TaxID=121492 RepID=UPI002E274234|nr:U2 small nuclear ribonucleoprotein auxiliary factor 35 kDa subunit-related protein 2-like [Corticium candelabrum]
MAEMKLNRAAKRRLLKKENRRAKRQEEARKNEEAERRLQTSPGYLQRLALEQEEAERIQQKEESERHREEELWVEREKKAQEEFNIRKLQQEEQERLEADARAREEQEAIEKKKQQEELLAQAIPQASNKEWCNPPAPVHHSSGGDKKPCPFFVKTGACRFGDRCSKHHDWPVISSTLLIPNMFNIFELDQQQLNEADQDVELEYDEREVYLKFIDFYEDIKPAFEDAGRVIQLKVCCNMEPHLRGNVYVQYENEEDASRAFTIFNGRWYAQHQLSVQFTSVNNWKAAICGLFHRNACPKGRYCNFLHVFRNPRNEFSELKRSSRDEAIHFSHYRFDTAAPRSYNHARSDRSGYEHDRFNRKQRRSSEKFSDTSEQKARGSHRHRRSKSRERPRTRDRTKLSHRESRSRSREGRARSRSRSRDRRRSRSKSYDRQRTSSRDRDRWSRSRSRAWSGNSDISDVDSPSNSDKHHSSKSRQSGKKKKKRRKSRSRERKRRHNNSDDEINHHNHKKHKARDLADDKQLDNEKEQMNSKDDNEDAGK